MTEPVVTHADLRALRAINDSLPISLVQEGPAQHLVDRLIAAAEADAPPLPEPMERGAVVVGDKGIEWVRVHPGGEAWVNGYGRWATWEDIGARTVKSPRPTVTEADVEKAVRHIGAVPGWTIDKTIRKALAALGIEVTS